MTRLLRTVVIAATATTILLVALMPPATSAEPAVRSLNQQLAAMISAVRAESDSSKQELAARKIPQLINGADLGQIDAGTLEDLASLLDIPNDEVRRWVATTLGMFENRARFAVPKLMTLLSQIDCPNVRERNSAGAVRFAIQSISGRNPPPVVCIQKLQEATGA
jgi:hypothetical protein